MIRYCYPSPLPTFLSSLIFDLERNQKEKKRIKEEKKKKKSSPMYECNLLCMVCFYAGGETTRGEHVRGRWKKEGSLGEEKKGRYSNGLQGLVCSGEEGRRLVGWWEMYTKIRHDQRYDTLSNRRV